jgi:hypothetical protein
MDGLGIINPNDALEALLTKWTIYTYMPRKSYLHVLLCHKFFYFQLAKCLTWPSNPNWILVKEYKKQTSSQIWNQIYKAWARIAKSIRLWPPTTLEGVTNLQLWWDSEFKSGNFKMSQERVQIFFQKGLK